MPLSADIREMRSILMDLNKFQKQKSGHEVDQHQAGKHQHKENGKTGTMGNLRLAEEKSSPMLWNNSVRAQPLSNPNGAFSEINIRVRLSSAW